MDEDKKRRNILVALKGPWIDTTRFHENVDKSSLKFIMQDPRVIEIMDYDTNEILYEK